jgi:hypothetical protein
MEPEEDAKDQTSTTSGPAAAEERELVGAGSGRG